MQNKGQRNGTPRYVEVTIVLPDNSVQVYIWNIYVQGGNGGFQPGPNWGF